ncbi:hypothetical protein L915_21921 [Phytophthora nicotianae]|uniref:Uncharacterized protein n=1 Tax=Phytophthora nicotianae TaxID=4792 RepID=W2FIY5_PHYNI|nr:hypothetical protein L915_21921 [Phytophthora nicotianae]
MRCPKVGYLGHRVSADGLEVHPKNLETLTTLPFPGTLRAIQSVFGSLNYYSRFIEDLAIYASILLTAQTDERDKWDRVQAAFEMLKNKIVTAPVLRHFDPDRIPVVVVYASDCAISAVVAQEHDGTYMPVPFTSRTLKPNELNYGLQGRLGNWAALLSHFSLEIVKCTRGEDEILGMIAASITPRESDDLILSSIAPRKQPHQQIPAVIPTIEQGEELLVVSFDGSARVKRGGGACSAIVWKIPEWIVVAAESKNLPDLTVNEVEYQGLLLGFDLLSSLDRGRLIIFGDSNWVIRQMRGEIECKVPDLTPLRRWALDRLRTWPAHEFLHVKRDGNQSADRLANTALHQQEGTVVTSEADHDDLVALNRLQELLLPKDEGFVVRMAATTRSRTRSKNSAEVLQLDVIQRIRTGRILRAQNEEKWIINFKAYLSGDLENLDAGEARSCGKIAGYYDVVDGGLHLYCPRAERDDSDRDRLAMLVVPEDLQQDVLHNYHASLKGGHQGVGRTYQWVRTHFHWRDLFKSVQRYVGQCMDCDTGKGRPTLRGESPGNIQATYPFQYIAMDHIPSLPKSYKGNIEPLIWVDLFTG